MNKRKITTRVSLSQMPKLTVTGHLLKHPTLAVEKENLWRNEGQNRVNDEL